MGLIMYLLKLLNLSGQNSELKHQKLRFLGERLSLRSKKEKSLKGMIFPLWVKKNETKFQKASK